jgi:hypothetical protein
MKRRTVILIVLVIATIALAGCYSGILAEDSDSLQGFLAILLTAGGIGTAVAFVFEKVPYVDEWFAALDSKAKRVVILVSSFVVPSVALGVAIGLDYYEFTPDLVYLALRAGFEAFTASQIVHMIVLRK